MKDNGIRIGKVSSVDYETGMLRVIYQDEEDSVTAMLPYANFNREYAMPQIGEMVLTAHLASGSSRGIVLGGFWNQKNKPEEFGKNIYKKFFSASSYIKYDNAEGKYEIKAREIEFKTNAEKITITQLLERIDAMEKNIEELKKMHE